MSHPSPDIPVVCDNGSGFAKVGYAEDNIPRFTFPSIVGRPTLRSDAALKDVVIKDTMVGDECEGPARSMLKLSYPISNGIIRDWDDMCLVWDYIFEQKLGLDEQERACRKILLTEAAGNPLKNRKKMVEIMFERYGWEAVNVQVQAVLTLYAQGLTNGVVVDSGDGVTHVVPVYESIPLTKGIQRIDLAGRQLTEYFIKLLQVRGYTFNSSADFEAIREMKEKLAYVGWDMEQEKRLARETTYPVATHTLPDGRTVRVGEERFMAPEALFSPYLVDIEHDGLSETVFKSIQSCPVDTRATLYQHVILSGGSTMYPGLPSRLERDLTNLYLEKVLNGDKSRLNRFFVKIEDPPHRKHFVFTGGAVFAKLVKDNDALWITKDMWEEQGENCVHFD